MKRSVSTWLNANTPSLISLAALGIVLVDVTSSQFEVTTTTLGLFVIAAIPWLGKHIDSFEGFGIRAQFKDLERKVEATEAKTATLEVIADKALEDSQVAIAQSTSTDLAVRLAPLRSEDAPSRSIRTEGWQSAAADLIRQYDSLRQTQQSSPERTRQMDALAEQMTGVMALASDFDATASLVATGGARLAAYTYLINHPSPEFLAPLIASLSAPESQTQWAKALRGEESTRRFAAQPLEQLWGLFALEGIVSLVGPENVPAQEYIRLTKFREDLAANGMSDRLFTLNRILAPIQARA